MECEICGIPFEAKTKWQRCCSPACRMKRWINEQAGPKVEAVKPIGNMLLELIEKYRASFLIGGLLDDKYIVSVPEMGDRNRTLEIEGKTPEEAIEKAHIEVTLRARKKEMEKVLIIWNSPS
jgi:predicted RNase H-like HicB family nuclease